ncbi:unnamed protein product [Phytophthora fragariaefolia]|uniref:Unnamed protein product n=1 Tax=Phytophthora fragariaefolia TaxID=1490495 RepID=A0A9W6XZN7_9STRA|nr:unnamed protein product [Phytophthora fragariaefolia]
MSSTSESGTGSAGPSAYHVMEKDLKPWELYDLSGAEGAENLDAMKEYFTRSPGRATLRSRSRDRGHLGEGGYAARTYLQPVNNQAGGHDNVSRGADVVTRDYSWHSRYREEESRGWRGHRDQPSAPRSIGVPPRHPPAAGTHHAGTGIGALSLGSEMIVASECPTPLGSKPAGASERLIPEQYRLMVMETDQARDDAMEAQNLAESARQRVAAAEAVAARSEQGRREVMERLRHLESLVCGGGARSSTPLREGRGLGLTRRQHGRSDYAPAADAPAVDATTVDAATAGALAATDQLPAQGSSQGHTA